MKKPAIPNSFPPTRGHMDAIAQNIETITGRRGTKCSLDTIANMDVSDPPTQDEVEALRAALEILIRRIET